MPSAGRGAGRKPVQRAVHLRTLCLHQATARSRKPPPTVCRVPAALTAKRGAGLGARPPLPCVQRPAAGPNGQRQGCSNTRWPTAGGAAWGLHRWSVVMTEVSRVAGKSPAAPSAAPAHGCPPEVCRMNTEQTIGLLGLKRGLRGSRPCPTGPLGAPGRAWEEPAHFLLRFPMGI